MEKSYFGIIRGFFEGLFGQLIAEIVLEKKLSELGFNKSRALSEPEAVDICFRLIGSFFRGFYTEEKIRLLKALFLIRLGMAEASERLSSALADGAKIFFKGLKKPSSEELHSFFNALKEDNEKEKRVLLCYEAIGLPLKLFAQATRKQAVRLSMSVAYKLIGEHAKTEEYNEKKKEALDKLFFNIFYCIEQKLSSYGGLSFSYKASDYKLEDGLAEKLDERKGVFPVYSAKLSFLISSVDYGFDVLIF